MSTHEHLYLGKAKRQTFKKRQAGGPQQKIVQRSDPQAHGQMLLEQASTAFKSIDVDRENLARAELRQPNHGTIVVVGEDPEFPMLLSPLNRKKRMAGSGRVPWQIIRGSSSNAQGGTRDKQQAAVWVADEARDEFLKLISEYAPPRHDKCAKPKREPLVANMAQVRIADPNDFTQDGTAVAENEKAWFRITFDERLYTEGNYQQVFEATCAKLKLEHLSESLSVGNTISRWAEVNHSDLKTMLTAGLSYQTIAKPEFLESPCDLSPEEQREYIEELTSRLSRLQADNQVVSGGSLGPRICLLDSGVNRGHLLLKPFLNQNDMYSIWGKSSPVNDVHAYGHGTQMAGLALYGDIEEALTSIRKIHVPHHLESVRIFPSRDDLAHFPHKSLALGLIQGVAAAEAGGEDADSRSFSLTITEPETITPHPSVASVSLDFLAAGGDPLITENHVKSSGAPEPVFARLFCVSAGNTKPEQNDYLAHCDASLIQSPAQAWNVLTVGAYTDKVGESKKTDYRGYEPLAEQGDLSPHSSTSTSQTGTSFPLKPEIVLEGGNVLVNRSSKSQGYFFETNAPHLNLLGPSHKHQDQLVVTNATSAATAQAARLAALSADEYPTFWPETHRGLLIHSATWTRAMRKRIKACNNSKGQTNRDEIEALIRRYGWGVPSLERIRRSAPNHVTLIAQDEFTHEDFHDGKARKTHVYDLPIPSEILKTQLANKQVQLKVTLSYFVVPNASDGAQERFDRYASHSLAFDLQRRGETDDEFLRYLSGAPQKDTQSRNSDSRHWLLGANKRYRGSVHQDIWKGNGATLATRNKLAVVPELGWIKDQVLNKGNDFTLRYGLIMTLSTAEDPIDLYSAMCKLATPVSSSSIGIPQSKAPVTADIVAETNIDLGAEKVQNPT